MPESQKISALMSVYHGTDAGELALCLDSIAAQSRPPDELVVVLDGPVSDATSDILEKHRPPIKAAAGRGTPQGSRPRAAIKIVPLPENRGLGAALNTGLAQCTHPLIARFDADDIFPPHRLQLQADFMAAHPDIAILGGRIAEFETAPGDMGANNIREVPPRPRADFYTAMRSPLNHMTVMFRRDAIRALGGYRDVPYMEDYDLWLRALAAGLRIANLPDILAHARIGSGMHARRRGLAHIRGEWAIFLAKLRTFGYYWWPVIAAAWVLRMTAKTILPARVLKAVYGRCLRK